MADPEISVIATADHSYSLFKIKFLQNEGLSEFMKFAISHIHFKEKVKAEFSLSGRWSKSSIENRGLFVAFIVNIPGYQGALKGTELR